VEAAALLLVVGRARLAEALEALLMVGREQMQLAQLLLVELAALQM
jgi:hypothetical protein